MLFRQQLRVHATFVFAEALGNDIAKIVIYRIFGGAEYIDVSVRFCQDQRDVGTGRDGMRPEDVQRDFSRPYDVNRTETIRCDLSKGAKVGVGRATKPVQTRQTIKGIEVIQVRLEVR